MVNKNQESEEIINDFIFHSELIIDYLTPKQVESLYNAIQPETTVEINMRAIAEISKENTCAIKMTFKAIDFISLRAILSSYLRWIEVILKSLQVVDVKK